MSRFTLEANPAHLPLHSLRTRQRESFGQDQDWHVYNSPMVLYEKYFAAALGGRTIFETAITQEAPVVAIDLMAPSGTIADLFGHLPPRLRGLAVSVSLEDL